jgi:transcriptional regulator with XRE-family HTH domain
MRYLGKAAKKVRIQSGMTQVKLAQELGISVVHLSNIENDHSMPSPELVNIGPLLVLIYMFWIGVIMVI